MGSVGFFFFSEHGHVAYQIKENQECTNMVANILPADPLPPSPVLWMGSEGQNSTFSEHGHVTYQIKENQECINMVANILLADPLTPLRPWGRGFRSKKILEHGHVAYQLKENH